MHLSNINKNIIKKRFFIERILKKKTENNKSPKNLKNANIFKRRYNFFLKKRLNSCKNINNKNSNKKNISKSSSFIINSKLNLLNKINVNKNNKINVNKNNKIGFYKKNNIKTLNNAIQKMNADFININNKMDNYIIKVRERFEVTIWEKHMNNYY